MLSFSKLSRKMRRAIVDIESFSCETGTRYRFVYRYGLMASGQNEGRLVALFDADTEEEVKGYIGLLDAKFHEYTDTLADIEYSEEGKCWYATYVVLYPFDNTEMSGPTDGQNAKPLF